MVLQILSGRFSGTDRTAAFLCSCAGIDGGLPFVAVDAPPPDPLRTAGQTVLRAEPAVFDRMPLGGDIRVHRAQILSLCDFSGAVGTACVPAHPGIGRALPFVAPVTDPPNLFLTSVGYRFRSQISIFWIDPIGAGALPCRSGCSIVSASHSRVSAPVLLGTISPWCSVPSSIALFFLKKK